MPTPLHRALTTTTLHLVVISLALTACPKGDDTAVEGLEYVDIPSGTFMMGCNEAIDTDCDGDETPYHEVFLSAYRIARTEVSLEMYAACVEAIECTSPIGEGLFEMRPDWPVTGVGKDQAARFCAWQGAALPTEAQWERAARGEDGRLYPWGSAPPDCELANWRACGRGLESVYAHESGASPYGALNMAGNAWEWVSDGYKATFYVESPHDDPECSGSSGIGLARGVDLYATPTALRASNRQLALTDTFSPLVGFRCVKETP
jgi:formylglycine-generating enzyme required for sulfatase activity